MRAVVVYESMYGNTHAVATHIAEGLRSRFEVDVVPVAEATAEQLAGCDVIVCGGPTHVHGMSSERSRAAAVAAVEKPSSPLSLDPAAAGPGLRDWFRGLPSGDGTAAAAFDTRIDGPAPLTGRAARGIARRLRDHGFRLVVGPESFLVDKQSRLLAGENERATAWGASLASAVAPAEGQLRA
ncbi:MAG TPA: flavodoxin domain-containing protein [Acidimicrobiales bacterium]|nr:flavodoxin domain-containing protein [Acidimicrobiales bacterium]